MKSLYQFLLCTALTLSMPCVGASMPGPGLRLDGAISFDWSKLTHPKAILSLAHCILSMRANSMHEANTKTQVLTDVVRLVKDLLFHNGIGIAAVLDLAHLAHHVTGQVQERPARSLITGTTHTILLPVLECLMDIDAIAYQGSTLASCAHALAFTSLTTEDESDGQRLYKQLHTLLRLGDTCIQTDYNRVALAWFSLHLYALLINTERGRNLRKPIRDCLDDLKKKFDGAF